MNLSIIIVNWNAKKYLLACLKSIVNEIVKFNNVEIIVVDNASTDGSHEAVKKYFPDIQIIVNKKNFGFSKANNIGIEKSNGKYICFINTDVELIHNCFVPMYDFMEVNENVGILGPCIVNPDLTVQQSCRYFPKLWHIIVEAFFLNRIFKKLKFFCQTMKSLPTDKVASVDVLSGCFWMVRREAINNVGLLDENFYIYSEDVDWCKRFKNIGWEIVYYPFVRAIHYGGASSSISPVHYYVEMQRSQLKYWCKYHSQLSSFSYRIVTFFHHINRILINSFLLLIIKSNRDIIIHKIQRSKATLPILFLI